MRNIFYYLCGLVRNRRRTLRKCDHLDPSAVDYVDLVFSEYP